MHSKSEIRKVVAQRRLQQVDPVETSQRILNRVTTLTKWASARSVLFYVDVRSEVRTSCLLDHLLNDRTRTDLQVVVPYCHGEELKLVHLHSIDELIPAAFGIREPCEKLRQSEDRHLSPEMLDLVLIPGVAFDRDGGRLGHGRGFYDRLLSRLRPDCLRIGLAFSCQLVERIPMEPHDQLMHLIITEEEIHSAPSVSEWIDVSVSSSEKMSEFH